MVDLYLDREFGKTSKSKLVGVHPDLVFLCYQVLYHSPYDIGVHCGVRTEEEQERMVELKVSWTMDSKHRLRVFEEIEEPVSGAIDFHVYDGTGQHFNLASLRRVYEEAWSPLSVEYKIPIAWGGHWRGDKKDGPHIQLATRSRLWVRKQESDQTLIGEV